MKIRIKIISKLRICSYIYVNHNIVKCKIIFYNYFIILTVNTYGRNVICVTTNFYINQCIGENLPPT